MSNLEKLLAKTQEQKSETVLLSTAKYFDVRSILTKSSFSVQNPEDSLRKCQNEEDFEYWKAQTLARYPDAYLVITKGADWFNEVRVSDPCFQTDRMKLKGAKASVLSSDGY